MRSTFLLAMFWTIGAGVDINGGTGAIAATGPSQTLIVPFADSSAENDGWIATAVGSSLLADLPHAVAGKIDDAPAGPAAHNAGARYVVTGQVQRVDTSIRLTAQLFDASGHPIGTAKESGDLHELLNLEDRLASDLRDHMRLTEQAHRARTPMPVIASAGALKIAPQPLLPVGTVSVFYSNRTFREGNQRNTYNTPYFEYDGLGFGGYGLGGFGFGGFGGGFGACGFGGFGFGSSSVGFATGGTGQGAY